jgi:hypothetical protein
MICGAIFEEPLDQQFTLKKAQQEARKKVYVSAQRLTPASSTVGAPLWNSPWSRGLFGK